MPNPESTTTLDAMHYLVADSVTPERADRALFLDEVIEHGLPGRPYAVYMLYVGSGFVPLTFAVLAQNESDAVDAMEEWCRDHDRESEIAEDLDPGDRDFGEYELTVHTLTDAEMKALLDARREETTKRLTLAMLIEWAANKPARAYVGRTRACKLCPIHDAVCELFGLRPKDVSVEGAEIIAYDAEGRELIVSTDFYVGDLYDAIDEAGGSYRCDMRREELLDVLYAFAKTPVNTRKRHVVEEAERELGLVSLVGERQSMGAWPDDQSIPALLAWWRDEAEIQRDTHHLTLTNGWRPEDAFAYASTIDSYADRLAILGVQPAKLPWE